MTSFSINTPFRLSAATVGVLVAYYLLPLDLNGSSDVLNLAIAALGIATLVYLVRVQWRIQMHSETEGGIFEGLALLLIVVVVLFALSYFVLEANRPGQFSGLSTRTDALYFAMTTLTTTGFGDIHAERGVARLLVSAQMLFDLAFLAALGAAFSYRLRRHPPRRRLA